MGRVFPEKEMGPGARMYLFLQKAENKAPGLKLTSYKEREERWFQKGQGSCDHCWVREKNQGFISGTITTTDLMQRSDLLDKFKKSLRCITVSLQIETFHSAWKLLKQKGKRLKIASGSS